jgi:hypothetical protein
MTTCNRETATARAVESHFLTNPNQLDWNRQGRTLITAQTIDLIGRFGVVSVGLFGIIIGVMLLGRGIWADEFVTLAWTTPKTSISEFLHLMITHEIHPILHYGIVYLLQVNGEMDVALLRSVNLLGVPIVIFSLAYAVRYNAITLLQSLMTFVLFTSSPIFFEYFAELRSYFLLYSVSIATSVLWYVLVSQIETGKKVSNGMVILWFADLLIYVNLHYFATVFGGLLTAFLLARLAVQRSWFQVYVFAGVSLIAATPALLLGIAQVLFSPLKDMTSWIDTSLKDSIKISLHMIENAAAWNLPVAASAVVMGLYTFENKKKLKELQIAMMLLVVVALFLAIVIILNGMTPLLVERYLIVGAGAVTLSVGIFAGSSGGPVWLPIAASVTALLLQVQVLRSPLVANDARGWLSSAKAVAQLTSECPSTIVLAFPAYLAINDTPEIALRVNAASYGYYAKKLRFSYENLLPEGSVEASGSCPKVIWIEHARYILNEIPNATAEQVLKFLHIHAFGSLELKQVETGLLILVRPHPNSPEIDQKSM